MKKILILLSILALTSATAFAQYTAKGVVEDKFGPVIGAAVIQVGTSNGVQTDLDGAWTLNVPSASTLLEISFLGLKTVTVEAGQAGHILMEDDHEFLDEVVVIGYGTVKKSDLTGSV
ncbi:MAG: carboxypeptidase-like regulatory domain-containing protein, partial [Bacteroidales bacterium]|nr:carboxypeptidase-like regulatory domain-containing protein [Bacteroidales bacterium]MCR5745794.1 carboxypeptidase-like regulatory domain-containing protein [Bacteroidales bacterium]